MLSTAGALYEKVMTEPLYTGELRVTSRMADPKTVNVATGFETPSTRTSKLESAGGLVASTLQAQIQEILSLMYVPVVPVKVAALTREVPVSGLGRAMRATARRPATKAREDLDLMVFNT